MAGCRETTSGCMQGLLRGRCLLCKAVSTLALFYFQFLYLGAIIYGENKRPNMAMEVSNNYVHFALEDFVIKLLINLP